MQVGAAAESAHESPHQRGSPVDTQFVNQVSRLQSGAAAAISHPSVSLQGEAGESSSDWVANGPLMLSSDSLRRLQDGPARQCWQSFCEATEADKVLLVQVMLNSIARESLSFIAVGINKALKADFVAVLPEELSEKIFSFLSFSDLSKCALVSRAWNRVTMSDALLRSRYRKQIVMDPTFGEFVSKQCPTDDMGRKAQLSGFRPLYLSLRQSYQRLEENWRTGKCQPTSLICGGNGVYCIQYDDHKLLSGSRDCKIRVWDLATQRCTAIFSGHSGSVLCLQYDHEKIVSGSSDSTARVWELATGMCRAILPHHTDSVLHLRFRGTQLVTCSKDFRVILWKMDAPFAYTQDKILVGHTAAVNVVDLTEEFIVSASGDRTIRVWSPTTGDCLRTITGHTRGIACLHLRGNLVVTGSSDETVRLWNIETGEQIRSMRGHQGLVRCIRFSDKYIISGSYDNSIIVWSVATGEQLAQLQGHESRVFRVQFDAFKIISSSQDDTIRIWDFTPKE